MNQEGFTIWLTGLPGSGKSTLARLIKEHFKKLDVASEILDGDEIRTRLTKDLGYSRTDREENIRRIAYVAKLITRVGGIAITAAISPYRTSREQARSEIPNFIEVYVQCPVEVCIKRDPKGLYAKAQRGEILNFTGVSDPYEAPVSPEISLQTDQHSPEECLQQIFEKLTELQLLPSMALKSLTFPRSQVRNDYQNKGIFSRKLPQHYLLICSLKNKEGCIDHQYAAPTQPEEIF